MHPVLFRQGPLVIYTHDFFTTLGLLAGLALYYYELRRRDMLSWRIVCISIAAIVGGGIGARTITAWEHLTYYRNFASVPLSYLIALSGKSIIGGLAGGYLAIVLSKRALGVLELKSVAATQIGGVADLPQRRGDSMLASAPQAVPPSEIAKLKGPEPAIASAPGATPAMANTPLTNPMLASAKQRQ